MAKFFRERSDRLREWRVMAPLFVLMGRQEREIARRKGSVEGRGGRECSADRSWFIENGIQVGIGIHDFSSFGS